MFSQKTKYGLKALLNLSRRYDTGAVLITDIARQETIPQKFLEAILLELKRKDILQSKKGKGGGYFLARSPHEITVAEIVRALEGPLIPDAKASEADVIELLIKEVRNVLSGVLAKTTLADLLDQSRRVNDAPFYSI